MSKKRPQDALYRAESVYILAEGTWAYHTFCLSTSNKHHASKK